MFMEVDFGPSDFQNVLGAIFFFTLIGAGLLCYLRVNLSNHSLEGSNHIHRSTCCL